MLDPLVTLLSICERLKSHGIFYKLSHVREDGITIEAAVPGERWEVEVFRDGRVEVEVFRSSGQIFDDSELETLIDKFSE